MQINDVLDTLSQFMGNRGNNIKNILELEKVEK